jgi:serine/threonine-protein kinase
VDVTLQDPLIGRVLDGRYRVEQRVAVGGMATVYRGVDTRLDRVVALKVMHPGFAADPEFVERFIREAKAVAKLSHPNVVGVFDQGEDHTAAPPAVFLAMEYVPGWTLRDLLRDRGALSPRTTLDILEPVLAALGAAHRAGLVHRDVKPENVLLTEDGRVKVADFGLVRAVNGQTAATTQQVMGTVSYLAPEQIERGAVDPRTDVYACGVLLHEMLTGAKPHTGESPMHVIYQHLSTDVPPPSQRVPGLPPQLDAITLAATARDAARRPADAVELLAELQRIRRELTPAQLDAEPGRTSPQAAQPSPLPLPEDAGSATTLLPPVGVAGPGGHPPVERTSIMDPGLLNELPADFVMPRHEAPEPPPTPRRGRAGRPRWAPG